MDRSREVRITVVSDNNGPVSGYSGPPLRTAWGLSCLIEAAGERILFDTGSDGSVLIENMRALGIDPESVGALVISHGHWDHTGGIDALLENGARPTVYLPHSFSAELRERLAARVRVVDVTARSAIGAACRTTGQLGSAIVEQALPVETLEGLVVVTGCAHPGIVEMVRVAAGDDHVAFVVGGFHLKDAVEREIDEAVSALQALGVRKVAPTHCTGDLAVARFADAFGDRFVRVGIGSVLQVGP